MSKLKPEHALMAALDCDAETLETNRRGEFTPRQYNTFARKYRRRVIVFPSLLGLILLVCAVFSVVAWLSGTELGAWVTSTICTGIIAVPFLKMALSSGSRRREYMNDLGEGVQVAEGPVSLSLIQYGNSARYTITIEGVFLNVSKTLFLAFKNGDPYRIFYARHSKTILSAEWLYDTLFGEDEEMGNGDEPSHGDDGRIGRSPTIEIDG